jgi:hypothetical protein
MPDIKEKIIPEQHEGGKKDIEHHITAANENDARKRFNISRNRLMNINGWHDVAGTLSAKFTLTDVQGHELNRTAEVNDFIKINIPAPKHAEGEGSDWVQIETIEDKSDPDDDYEIIGFRVRPVGDPKQKGENVAHFFNQAATSTFMIERHGNKITAAVFGRNETPNTETNTLIDKIRNAVVGATAIIGFSNIQWNSLVKGFLED